MSVRESDLDKNKMAKERWEREYARMHKRDADFTTISGMDLPPHLKGQFPDFVRAMFTRQVDRQDMSTVFTEYAWEASTCDPCPGPPLTAWEMRQLGAF